MDPTPARPPVNVPPGTTGEGAVSPADERFQRLLDKTTDGILVLGTDGSVRYANPAAEALFGRPSGDLLGTPFGYPLVAGESVEVEVLQRGQPLPVEMRLVETEWDGEPGLLVMLHDISGRRRLEAERRAAEAHLAEVQRLRERDGFKTQFINTTAHELGTPLTPIRLQLELLQRVHAPLLPPEARNSVEILSRNVDRLSRLIRDMLQVARIQAGKVLLNLQEIDLLRVAQDALESFRDPARLAQVELELAALGPLPVRADAARLGQVFDNLLDNALKFTPPGGRVTVAARAEGDRVVVAITDTGRGVRPRDLPKLFRAYSQVQDPAQGLVRGTGLGLFICKGIVEAHGGTIHASSAGPGRGSTFRFDLPRAGTSAGPPAGRDRPPGRRREPLMGRAEGAPARRQET